MPKKNPKPPKQRRAAQKKKAKPSFGLINKGAAILLLLGVVGVAIWLGKREHVPPSPDEQRLEKLLRQVLVRFPMAETSLTWEKRESPSPTLVVVLGTAKEFPLQQFALDLEAALHNLGGQLEPLPVLEEGGYGRAAFRGRLGDVWLRLLILGVQTEKEPKAQISRNHLVRQQKGKLAIVLDDAGYSLDVLPAVAQLPKAVAVAVLPNAPKAEEVARVLHSQGRELLLHMPMEPQGNGVSPGGGAIAVGLSETEVKQRLEAALKVVEPVSGLNNHMGSRATADRLTMKAFMNALRGKGLYFLDSRTTAASVAAAMAQEADIPTLRRDVFLDVVAEKAFVHSSLDTATALARARGSAVAIGHVHPVTLQVLAHDLPQLEGVELVRPSQLITSHKR